MFAEDISRVLIAFNVVETNNGSSNGFPNLMEGECIMSLMKLSMWDSRAI